MLIRWIVIYPVNSAIQRLNESSLASFVQKVDSAIHRINLYPMDNATDFPNTYPLDNDLSGE